MKTKMIRKPRVPGFAVGAVIAPPAAPGTGPTPLQREMRKRAAAATGQAHPAPPQHRGPAKCSAGVG